MNTASTSRVVVPMKQSADGYLPLFEAILFSAGKPLSPDQIATATGCNTQFAKHALDHLAEQLEGTNRGLRIAWVGTSAQLVSKPQYQQAIEAVRHTDIDRLTAVVEEYLHIQQLNGRRPGTIKGYRLFLTRFVKSVGKPVDQITPRDIRFFLMAEEQRGNCRNTLATKTVILRSFFGWCEKDDLIDKDPMRKIDKPKEDKADPKFLTREEIELIREAAIKPLDRALVEVLYGSGLRISEAAALDWSDIDWSTMEIAVRDGKGGKSRVAPMSTRAKLLLGKLKETRTDEDSCVFRSQFKRRMSTAMLQRRVNDIGVRAGIKTKLTPHRFRHSLATHLLASGTPIDVVQAILGHESVATTQVYAKTQRASVEMYYRRFMS
jgi:integrase/recombinase XerD